MSQHLRTRFLKIYLSSFAFLVAAVVVVTLGIAAVRIVGMAGDISALEQFETFVQIILSLFSLPVLCLWLFLMLGIAAIIAVACLYRLDKKVTAPIEALSNSAKQICAGEYDTEIIGADDAEIADLSRALNALRLQLKANKEAERLAESKRNLLFANISHDMRTPITTIRGYLQAMEDGVASTPEQIDACYRHISEKTVFLENLAAELSEYSAAASGRLSYHFEDVELCGFLADMAEEYREEIENRDFCFQTEYPSEPVMIRGDRHHLQRVLQNLLANAMKYNHPGGSIAVRLEAAVPYCYLAVADSGIGIGKESVKKVFETFYREDQSRGVADGHGLGLAIAAEIVAAHGGKIWLQSEAGQGTEVFIRLPLKEKEEKEKEKTENKEVKTNENFNCGG